LSEGFCTDFLFCLQYQDVNARLLFRRIFGSLTVVAFPPSRPTVESVSIAVPAGAVQSAGGGLDGFAVRLKRLQWAPCPLQTLQPRAGRVDLRAPAKQVGRAYPVTKLSPDTAMSKAFPKETREAAAKPLLKFVGEADTATFLFSLISLNCGESRNNLPRLQPKSPLYL